MGVETVKVYLVRWHYDEQSGIEHVCSSKEVAEARRRDFIASCPKEVGRDQDDNPIFEDKDGLPLDENEVYVEEWEVEQ